MEPNDTTASVEELLAAITPEQMPSQDSFGMALAALAQVSGIEDPTRIAVKARDNPHLRLAIVNLAREFDQIKSENPLGDRSEYLRRFTANWLEQKQNEAMRASIDRTTTAIRREREQQRQDQRLAKNAAVRPQRSLSRAIWLALYQPGYVESIPA